jgi:hypothetical protein
VDMIKWWKLSTVSLFQASCAFRCATNQRMPTPGTDMVDFYLQFFNSRQSHTRACHTTSHTKRLVAKRLEHALSK